MNTSKSPSSNPVRNRRGLRLAGMTMVALLGVIGAAGSGAVRAQSTSGTIFGKVPAGATVVAKNTSTGLEREAMGDSKGRYRLPALPIGTYNMVLEQNGEPVLRRLNVPVSVGGGIKVDFDCTQYKCAAQ